MNKFESAQEWTVEDWTRLQDSYLVGHGDFPIGTAATQRDADSFIAEHKRSLSRALSSLREERDRLTGGLSKAREILQQQQYSVDDRRIRAVIAIDTAVSAILPAGEEAESLGKAKDCIFDLGSSRMCERGTEGCICDHTAEEAQTLEIKEPASEKPPEHCPHEVESLRSRLRIQTEALRQALQAIPTTHGAFKVVASALAQTEPAEGEKK